MSRRDSHDQDSDPPAEEHLVTARDMLKVSSPLSDGASDRSPREAAAVDSQDAGGADEAEEAAGEEVEHEEEEEEELEAEVEAEEEDGRAHPFSRRASNRYRDDDDEAREAAELPKHGHFSLASLFHSHHAQRGGEQAQAGPSTPRRSAAGRHALPITRTISFREGGTPRRQRRRTDTVDGPGAEDDEEVDDDALSVTDAGEGWARSPDGRRRTLGIPLSNTWSRSTVGTLDTAEAYQPRFPPSRVLQGLRDHRAARRQRRDTVRAAAEDAADEDEDALASQKKIRGMPVFSGLLAPFSIMLEVPGITSKWYLRVGGGFYRQNPIILDVGLAISMASAVIANGAIVARFTGRACPRRSTLIAIACFLLHDTINVVALAIFGVVHAIDDGFTYSEAFWMTAGSTFASVLCTVTLLMDFVGTKDFKNSGSGLTPAQTRLVIVVMAFLTFLSLGSMIYALLLPLVFLDAVYYFMTTMATVGLGDIVPKTVAERILLFFLAPIGIVMLAILVTAARETLMEEFEAQYKRRRAKFKRKQQQRLEARQLNRRAIKEIKRGYGRGGGATTGLPPAALLFPVLSPTNPFGGALRDQDKKSKEKANSPQFESLRPLTTIDGLKQRWNLGFARQPLRSPALSDPEGGTSAALGTDGSRSAKSSHTAADSSSSSSDKGEKTASPPSDGKGDEAQTAGVSPGAHDVVDEMARMEAQLLAQREALDKDWKDFKERLDTSERRDFWLKLVLTFTLFFSFWMIGAGVFHATERWTFFECLYFTFIVFSTIGYGDFTPKTPAGRAFFIVWALLGVGILTIMFAVLSDAWGNALKRGATGASFENLVQKRKVRAVRKDHPGDAGRRKPLAGLRKRLGRGGKRDAADHEHEASSTQTEGRGELDVTSSPSLGFGRIPSKPLQTSPTIAPAILEAAAPIVQATLPRDTELVAPPPSASILKSPDTGTTLMDSPKPMEAALSFAEPAKGQLASASQESTSPLPADLHPADDDEIPIHDMPLALARSAMSVHQHIVAYNKTQRRLVLDTIRSVPELAHLLVSEIAEHQPHPSTSQAGAPRRETQQATKITPQHKEKLLSAARSFHDPAAEAAVAGWIEMRQFEDELHTLIAKTSSIRDELLDRQSKLERSRQKIEALERELERAAGSAGTEEHDEDDEDTESEDDESDHEREAPTPHRIEEA